MLRSIIFAEKDVASRNDSEIDSRGTATIATIPKQADLSSHST